MGQPHDVEYMSGLLNFLELRVLNVVVLLVVVCLLAALSTLCTLSSALCVHLGTCCLPCVVKLCCSCVDTSEVLCLVSLLELLYCRFDRSLLVCRDLVAELAQLVLCLEYH